MIRRFADVEELSRTAAEELCLVAREAIAAHGRFTVAMAGGKTPRRLYELLAEPPCRARVPWDRVEIFFGDERAVRPDHPDSNFRMVHEAMLRSLDVPEERVHRIKGESGDVDASAREYEAEIARVLGRGPGGEPPSFDLVLLGLGADGHAASLFPFGEALDAGERWVAPERKATPARLTMTPRLLNASRRIWFLVSGADKAAALRAVISGDQEDSRRIPARLIRPATGSATWLVDRPAASALREESPPSGVAVQEVPGHPFLREPVVEPCAFVIFGAAGDLTRRKLVPALYNLVLEGCLPDAMAVIGVSREAISAQQWRAQLRESTQRFSRRRPLDQGAWERLAPRLDYLAGSLEDPRTFVQLRERLEAQERTGATSGHRIFYLAVPPQLFPVVIQNLHRAALLYEHRSSGAKPWCRVVIEKPFGRDLESARALNRLLAAHLDESQIFRIDHYLGKETVQNILVFRLGNSIFEPLWERTAIDHVQITAAESIGLEGRGRFYDGTGVLRDMVQSHLLSLLALCAAEVPVSFLPDDVRDQQAYVLRSLHPLAGEAVARQVVRAQYRGYLHEEGVSPRSRTETYAAMKVLIDNWRWQGVPFYLRAGKKLAARVTEIAIEFRPIPLCLFRHVTQGCQNVQPNVLLLRIQPDESISLRFVAKVPGNDLTVGNVLMNMSYATSFGRPISEAYERLLLDVMRGDLTLFARRDVVEHAWGFVTPILQAWDADRESPLPTYEPGSQGPVEADDLIARDGRRWRQIG